ESARRPGANPSDERLAELLAGRTLDDLSPDEVDAMNTLLAEYPELEHAEAEALEAAAALLMVAEASSDRDASTRLPAALRDRLHAEAAVFRSDRPVEETAPLAFATAEAEAPGSRAGRGLTFFAGGLAGALAASLLFAVILSSRSVTDTARTPPPDQAYAFWEANVAEFAVHDWAAQRPGYTQVAGHVAWSDTTQTGYLVLDGLPANDPAVAQYQLWIVDPARDDFPVDGGVFDVAPNLAADGRAYVPIDAKLPVDRPAAFAVTLEQPGGVVRSENPLLLVASTGRT
ncbi:MAG: anti-sigma factor, partial [Planctomycetota bacterium]